MPLAALSSGSPPTDPEEVELPRLWRALLRSRWLVLGLTGVAIGIAFVVTALQTRMYESEATVLIEGDREGRNFLRGLMPAGLGAVAGLGGVGQDIQTDLAVLRSRQVAEAVVDSLALRVSMVEGERYSRSHVLRVIELPRGSHQGVYRLQRQGDASYLLRVEEGEALPSLPITVRIGEPFHIGDVTLALTATVGEDLPERIRFRIRPFRAAVADIREDLRVARPLAGGQVLAIQFRHPDPEFAAAVPNAVAASFVEYKNRVGTADANSTIAFLHEQSLAYEAELRNAEARLQLFREQAHIVEPQAQATEQIRRLAQVQAERDALHAERESLRRLIARVDAAPDGRVGSTAYRQIAAFPTFISNGAVQDIFRSLTQYENQRAELMVRRTEQSVDVQGIDDRIGALERELYHLTRNYLGGIENQIVSLDAALGGYAREMQQVPSREVELLRLTREQNLLEQVYTLVQTRLKEEQIRAAADAANVRVIDAALIPEGPSFPNRTLNLALATVLGLMLSASLVFVREVRDRRVRTASDASGAAWGLPILGVVPPDDSNPNAVLSGNGSNGHRILSRARRAVTAHKASVPTTAPRAAVAEAYRALRANLSYAQPDGSPQMLMVTSAMAGEGTAAVAVNLASAFAQQQVATLLIDTGFSAEDLHAQLGENRMAPGLSEILLGRVDWDSAVQEVRTRGGKHHLHFLSAGSTAVAEQEELYTSNRVELLLDQLRSRYARIIINGPSLSRLSDAAVLGHAVDATVVVARLDVTDREALQHAVHQLHRMGIPVGGIILTASHRTDGILVHRAHKEPGDATAAAG